MSVMHVEVYLARVYTSQIQWSTHTTTHAAQKRKRTKCSLSWSWPATLAYLTKTRITWRSPQQALIPWWTSTSRTPLYITMSSSCLLSWSNIRVRRRKVEQEGQSKLLEAASRTLKEIISLISYHVRNELSWCLKMLPNLYKSCQRTSMQ